MMKLAFRTKYGTPEVLSIKEVEIPAPADNEVLIKIHATTVNKTDHHILRGTPFILRLFTGVFKPKSNYTGSDFAGEVMATGKAVTHFNIDERLMGFGGGFLPIGSQAEYILLPEAKALKITVGIPGHLSYEEAVACIEGAFYAASQLNPLKPQSGQKALVYGATGAIGSAYVQFLKYYGVFITAVCKSEHHELVRSLGASRVVDYTKEDFTKDDEQYDYVFDAVGKSSFLKCKRLLKKNGIYTSSDGFINLFLIPLTKLFGGRRVVFSFTADFTGTLSFIRDLAEQKHFTAVIDRKYTLEQIADAYRYVATGQKIGNVIITMDT
jgi:NADPH:quinone reductase-like Zn-dependent oxidoreductase